MTIGTEGRPNLYMQSETLQQSASYLQFIHAHLQPHRHVYFTDERFGHLKNSAAFFPAKATEPSSMLPKYIIENIVQLPSKDLSDNYIFRWDYLT